MCMAPFENKACAPSADPRKEGSCVRCGRAIPAPEPPRAERDHGFEVAFLNQVVEMATRLTGNASLAYPHRVLSRLKAGEKTYGSKWATIPNVDEILEETPDVTGYSMLEIQRLALEGYDPEVIAEVQQDLLAASAYSCVADFYALRAKRVLAGTD